METQRTKDLKRLLSNHFNSRNDFYVFDVYEQLYCIKCAGKMELKADKEVILSSMLRSMQRDLERGSRFEHE